MAKKVKVVDEAVLKAVREDNERHLALLAEAARERCENGGMTGDDWDMFMNGDLY
jgi:hypothetical protein